MIITFYDIRGKETIISVNDIGAIQRNEHDFIDSMSNSIPTFTVFLIHEHLFFEVNESSKNWIKNEWFNYIGELEEEE